VETNIFEKRRKGPPFGFYSKKCSFRPPFIILPRLYALHIADPYVVAVADSCFIAEQFFYLHAIVQSRCRGGETKLPKTGENICNHLYSSIGIQYYALLLFHTHPIHDSIIKVTDFTFDEFQNSPKIVKNSVFLVYFVGYFSQFCVVQGFGGPENSPPQQTVMDITGTFTMERPKLCNKLLIPKNVLQIVPQLFDFLCTTLSPMDALLSAIVHYGSHVLLNTRKFFEARFASRASTTTLEMKQGQNEPKLRQHLVAPNFMRGPELVYPRMRLHK
jgi:hypothetical protein